MNVCKQILEHFGEVQAIGRGGYYIPKGKAILGYLGSSDENGSGCQGSYISPLQADAGKEGGGGD